MKELDEDFICDNEIGKAIVNGREVYYTNLRIRNADVPDGFFKYEIRSSDFDDTWATIENFVWVNHIATILTDEPFEMVNHGYNENDKYLEISSYEITEDFWD